MEFKDGDVIQVNGKPCRIEGGALVPVVERGPLGGELKRLGECKINEIVVYRGFSEDFYGGLQPSAMVETNVPPRPTFSIFLCKYFIPAEFAWIKRGIKVDLTEDAWHGRGIDQTLTVVSDPFYTPNLNKCVVQCRPDFGLLMWCEELQPAKNPKITLTLTRHQAQALLLQMQKLDGVSRGFIEDEKFYREIESMIEEQLK